MKKLYSRHYRVGDEESIVAIYNVITGRTRTVEQHLWQWHDAINMDSIWTINEKNNDRLVGHHGLMPFNFNFEGKTFRLGKTENTIMHPDYSGNGIYFIFEKKIIKEALTKFDVLLTTSGYGTPGRIRIRLGYQPVSHYAYYARLTSFNALNNFVNTFINKLVKNNFVKKLLALPKWIVEAVTWLALKHRISAENTSITTEQVFDIETIHESLDDFCKLNTDKLGYTIPRSAKLIKWKFFNNPNAKYQFIVAKQNEKIVGYIVASLNEDVPFALISDMVVENNSKRIFGLLINALIGSYQQQEPGLLIFPTLAGKNQLVELLRSSGFFSVGLLNKIFPKIFSRFMPPATSKLLVKINENSDIDEKIYDSNRWYFTGLFLEGRL